MYAHLTPSLATTLPPYNVTRCTSKLPALYSSRHFVKASTISFIHFQWFLCELLLVFITGGGVYPYRTFLYHFVVFTELKQDRDGKDREVCHCGTIRYLIIVINTLFNVLNIVHFHSLVHAIAPSSGSFTAVKLIWVRSNII